VSTAALESSVYRTGPRQAGLRVMTIVTGGIGALLFTASGILHGGTGWGWGSVLGVAVSLTTAVLGLLQGYRVAYEVEFSDGRLTWRAPFATIEVPLTHVTELGRRRFPSRNAVLVAGGRRLLVPRRADDVQFADALGRALPHLDAWALSRPPH